MLVSMDSSELREQLVRTVMSYRRMDRANAEDAVQDAYVYALKTKHPWDGRSTLRTWLTRVAINAWRMQLRKRIPIEDHETVFDDAHKVPGDHSPFDRVAGLERFEVAEDVILAEMSAKNRVALLLLIANPDGGYKESAEKLGLCMNTFKARVHDARKILRAVL